MSFGGETPLYLLREGCTIERRMEHCVARGMLRFGLVFLSMSPEAKFHLRPTCEVRYVRVGFETRRLSVYVCVEGLLLPVVVVVLVSFRSQVQHAPPPIAHWYGSVVLDDAPAGWSFNNVSTYMTRIHAFV